MINVILQFLGLDLFNIKLSAKSYQNIPNGLRVNFHFFQNLNRGKTSTNPKCHLTISWATSCQYTNVYAKFHHNIPLSSRDRAIFTFFRIWSCDEPGSQQNDNSPLYILTLLISISINRCLETNRKTYYCGMDLFFYIIVCPI